MYRNVTHDKLLWCKYGCVQHFHHALLAAASRFVPVKCNFHSVSNESDKGFIVKLHLHVMPIIFMIVMLGSMNSACVCGCHNHFSLKHHPHT